MYDNVAQQTATGISGGRLGSATIAPPDESPSQIRDAIGGCEEYLGHMHELIGMLERRLDTVLTPAAPQTKNEASTKAPTPVSSHVRGRLDILNDGWRNALQRLESIHQRVEV